LFRAAACTPRYRSLNTQIRSKAAHGVEKIDLHFALDVLATLRSLPRKAPAVGKQIFETVEAKEIVEGAVIEFKPCG
jgi:hypothetical protein